MIGMRFGLSASGHDLERYSRSRFEYGNGRPLADTFIFARDIKDCNHWSKLHDRFAQGSWYSSCDPRWSDGPTEATARSRTSFHLIAPTFGESRLGWMKDAASICIGVSTGHARWLAKLARHILRDLWAIGRISGEFRSNTAARSTMDGVSYQLRAGNRR